MDTASSEVAVLTRPAARLWGIARVFARHWDGIAAPARARLVLEMDEAAEGLRRALSDSFGGREASSPDIDASLRLRCSCL
jgi:hypothetical protein